MYNENEILSHHGVKGQRWGFRRYQNPDGSLTPAGRKRAQNLKEQYKKLTGKKLKGKIPNEDPSKKKVKELTDVELTDRIIRLRNEKEAHLLERDLSSNGRKFIRSLGKDILAPAAINAGRSVMQKVFYNKMSKALGVDENGIKDSFKELKKSTETAELKSRKAAAEKKLRDLKEQERKAKEKENQNKQEPKERVIVGDMFIFNNKPYDEYANKGKTIVEAKWKEKDSNNKKKGKRLFNDLYD